MAIAPAGAAYKSLTFDNKTSREFGVYITGEAVYNAPEREVEMITIPGRNGAFALDKGRFENIPVKYPAGMFGDSETNFRTALSDFRNFLCSKKGYCRLTDDYNPDEYRLAVYKSGLEVDKVRDIAGEFEILFDAMPQRWLTSGEVKQTIAASGDAISNPTLFSSKPLLEVVGYGTIGFNGYEIELANETVGDVDIPEGSSYNAPYDITFPSVYIAQGDDIEIDGAFINLSFQRKTSPGNYSFSSGDSSITSWSGYASASPTIASSGLYTGTVRIPFTTPFEPDYGTFEARTVTCTARLCFKRNGTDYFHNVTITAKLRYGDPDDDTVRIDYSLSNMNSSIVLSGVLCGTSGGVIHSTATTYGNPTYIDCDLGEAYAINNNVVSSLNSYIDLGSELPTLAPGSNTITFDNTITSLKITPRWYKL